MMGQWQQFVFAKTCFDGNKWDTQDAKMVGLALDERGVEMDSRQLL